MKRQIMMLMTRGQLANPDVTGSDCRQIDLIDKFSAYCSPARGDCSPREIPLVVRGGPSNGDGGGVVHAGTALPVCDDITPITPTRGGKDYFCFCTPYTLRPRLSFKPLSSSSWPEKRHAAWVMPAERQLMTKEARTNQPSCSKRAG